jgi:hypothetical protein
MRTRNPERETELVFAILLFGTLRATNNTLGRDMQYAPAAGVSVADNSQDIGTSRWQPAKSIYTNFRGAWKALDWRKWPNAGPASSQGIPHQPRVMRGVPRNIAELASRSSAEALAPFV